MTNACNFGICKVSVAPVYETVQDTSAIVTQLLFGETFKIEDTFKGWLKVQVAFDGYVGWINAIQAERIDEITFEKIINSETRYLKSMVALVQSDKGSVPILMGSSLNCFENDFFLVGSEYFALKNGETCIANRQTPDMIEEFALKYANAPYLWGGRSPFGIDCSGFVQNVFRFCGYKLPRDANQQITVGESINLLNEAKPNDLMFFSREEDTPIVHVGIYLGNNAIIHASGMVKIDPIDHLGIYSKEQKKYTHLLKQIKRIL